MQKNTAGMDENELIQKYLELKEQVGHLPTVREWLKNVGGQAVIFKKFGSWNQFTMKCNGMTRVNRDVNKNIYSEDELLALLQKYMTTHTEAPTVKEWEQEGFPRYLVIKRFFGTYEKFLAQGGYKCVKSGKKSQFDRGEALAFYRRLQLELVKEPSGADWDKREDKPCSSRTVIREFGTWGAVGKSV